MSERTLDAIGTAIMLAFLLLTVFIAIDLKCIADDVHAIRQSLAVPEVQPADKHGIGEKEK